MGFEQEYKKAEQEILNTGQPPSDDRLLASIFDPPKVGDNCHVSLARRVGQYAKEVGTGAVGGPLAGAIAMGAFCTASIMDGAICLAAGPANVIGGGALVGLIAGPVVGALDAHRQIRYAQDKCKADRARW